MKTSDKSITSFKRQFVLFLGFLVALSVLLTLSSCDNDDEPGPGIEIPDLTGNSISYDLSAASGSGVSGSVSFEETVENTTLVTFSITGGTPGGVHPTHIHNNSMAEGGGIAISLGEIDGSSGMHQAVVASMDDGSSISYDDLLDFDGHINIHASPENLSTIVARTDIGSNELTGQQEDYDLIGLGDFGLSGEALFQERKSGETLVTLTVEGSTGTADHPAHIHADNAVDGGGIEISLNPVDNETGVSQTHISEKDDGTPVSYSELEDYDGHINVHLSGEELSTVILHGDIGQNELTSDTEEYMINSRYQDNISGMATFTRRRNDETLVEIMLENTSDGASHPSHIHNNTAAEGGGIAISLSNIDGHSGISKTNITEFNDETPVTYDELIEFDGYINVHLSAESLGTTVAQGDIGQNALTGESESYDLGSVSDPEISGTVVFYERVNETTLVEITLQGTSEGNTHPAHIHENDAATGGGVVIGLSSVNGSSGISRSQIEEFNDGTPLTYDDLIDYDGHVNVHLSVNDLATLIAQGDIGANAQ